MVGPRTTSSVPQSKDMKSIKGTHIQRDWRNYESASRVEHQGVDSRNAVNFILYRSIVDVIDIRGVFNRISTSVARGLICQSVDIFGIVSYDHNFIFSSYFKFMAIRDYQIAKIRTKNIGYVPCFGWFS